jgi:hypothetical protein
MFDNGQSISVPVSVRGRGGVAVDRCAGDENPEFPPLSAIGTAHAPPPASGISRSGRGTMEKFEALAFAVGFIATGFLTFVASMPIA